MIILSSVGEYESWCLHGYFRNMAAIDSAYSLLMNPGLFGARITVTISLMTSWHGNTFRYHGRFVIEIRPMIRSIDIFLVIDLNKSTNCRDSGNLRRHDAHDVTVMCWRAVLVILSRHVRDVYAWWTILHSSKNSIWHYWDLPWSGKNIFWN